MAATSAFDLDQILRAYSNDEPDRAMGGVRALTGFDFQTRVYLAELFAALTAASASTSASGSLLDAGLAFVEALSDVLLKRPQDLVCVQVKRTLEADSIRDAAQEVLAIDRFMAARFPSERASLRYAIVTNRIEGTAASWPHKWTRDGKSYDLTALANAGQLLPPRVERDPWWRVIATLLPVVEDPFALARYALDRALARGLSFSVDSAIARAQSNEEATKVRNDIVERFVRARQQQPIGEVPRPEDFTPSATPTQQLEVGRSPTLARLRDQQYMPRADRVAAARRELEALREQRTRAPLSRVDVFWIVGRSGAG